MLYGFFCWNRKYLMANLVSRNLKLRYRKSSLGFLWTLLVPAAMALTYFFVFNFVIKVKVEGYLLYLIAGLIPWTFFSSAVMTSTESVVNNYALLSKVPIPFNAFPLSDVVAAYFNFLLSVPVLVAIACFYHKFPSWSWISLALPFACIFIQGYSFGLVFSVIYVHLRDMRHLVGIGMQLWLYFTPILYQSKDIPERFSRYFLINPLFYIFDSIHGTFMRGEWPNQLAVTHMIASTCFLMIAALIVYVKVGDNLVERI